MSNLFLSASFFDALIPIAKWLTIGLLAAFFILLIFFAICKKPLIKKITKFSAVGLIFYVIVMGILLLISGISKEFSHSSLEENGLNFDVVFFVLLPILCTFIVALLGMISIILMGKIKPSSVKKLSLVFCAVLFLFVAASLILIYVYYYNNTKDWYKYNQLALWIGSMLLVAGVIIASFFLDKKGSLQFDTKCLTMAGVFIALSFVLSFIKIIDPPTGGSVTLASLFPVMLFAYIYGMKKGLLIGFIYGILQAVQEPWIVHPAQFLLDYPIAFSMVGLCGALNNFKALNNLPQIKFAIGAIIAVVFRFVSSVIAGIFAWEANLIASLSINSVILLDVILVIVVGIILFSSKSFVNEVYKLNPSLMSDNDH